MYSIDAFKYDLDQCHAEITFDMADGHYFISDSMGKGILIYGPNNDNERVSTSDEVLDNLIVVGRTMREVIHLIDPD